MKVHWQASLFFLLLFCSGEIVAQEAVRFNMERDLLLAHFDCKTDVDDLHSVAALATLMSHTEYQKVRFHAVAGAYGMQNGLYVPPNTLFEMAFGENWSDAHINREQALKSVSALAVSTLDSGGSLWIAEAGQSDFSAALVRKLQELRPNINTSERIHVVQHSNWNEEVTTQTDLAFVKRETSYHKIPDGNTVGNGSPGFLTKEAVDPGDYLSSKKVSAIWEHAIALANQYNGAENRYLNQAIAKGGLDFSDHSEVCWIMGMEGLQDVKAYFAFVGRR